MLIAKSQQHFYLSTLYFKLLKRREDIMPTRHASAQWQGSLKEGQGQMQFGSFSGKYSAASRFEDGEGTNPEELIGAAHAGCFSMAFAVQLGNAGYNPKNIQTKADVRIEKVGDGFKITNILLNTEAEVPEISEDEFSKLADAAKSGCPVSQALAGVDIGLNAKLVS
jgi:osmotically inducible protein OsmC